MNGWLIHTAREQDVGAILAIERALARAPHWAEAEYMRIVRSQGVIHRCLLVGEEDGQMVGFAVGAVVAGVGELESVAVRESRQGCGLGSELVRAVLQWCRAEGTREVCLEVRAASLVAQRLYARLGFVAVGHRPAYYSDPVDDAVLMRVGVGQEDHLK